MYDKNVPDPLRLVQIDTCDSFQYRYDNLGSKSVVLSVMLDGIYVGNT